MDALGRLNSGVGGWRVGPVLRTMRRRVWTMATNGHALLAIEGAHTSAATGPANMLRELGSLDAGRVTSRQRLAAFLSEPVMPDPGGWQRVIVAGVIVQRSLLGRLLRGFDSELVTVRATKTRVNGCRWALTVEGGDAFAICMGCVGGKPARRYRFERGTK